MKLLKRVLLIHWHYFDIEEIEFDQLNFLTGQNASGKSTLIDAMQLVLLADTGGRFFNKSTGGRTNRTLKGYLMGELGDDEASGFRYLRDGRFTSYISLEFYDEEKKRYFTAGICFDVYGEADIPRIFFLYDGPLDEDRFLRNKVPMDIRSLKADLKDKYPGHTLTTDSGSEFRSAFYGKLGGLRDRFGTLLKKAVSFNPDMDLQKFITEFVCDIQQPVDVTHMQENIRSYKMLEEESAILKERTELLDKIVATAEDYENQKQSEQLYSYLIERSKQTIQEEELVSAKTKLEDFTVRLDQWREAEEALAKDLAQLDRDRDELKLQKDRNGAALAVERLDSQIRQLEAEKQAGVTTYQSGVMTLLKEFREWERTAGELKARIETTDQALFDPAIASRLEDIVVLSDRTRLSLEPLFSRKAQDYGNLEESIFVNANEASQQLQSLSQELNTRLKDLQSQNEKIIATKDLELSDLEKGIFPFPKEAMDLKDAIHSRLLVETGQEVLVRIAAEAADLRDERWRNAIEGYLHTQKYYLLIDPEYFTRATRIYDDIKHARKIYGTGIVDLEKLRNQTKGIQPGSLAEEIRTEDELAKTYFDHVLGQVQKCVAVDELRQHRTAITEQGMLYSSFVVRAINPERWSKPAIGQGAHQRRIETLVRELAELNELQSQCQGLLTALNKGSTMAQISPREWLLYFGSFQVWRKIPELDNKIGDLQETRRSIDTSQLDQIELKIRQVDDLIQNGKNDQRNLNQKIGTTRNEKAALQTEKIPVIEQEIKAIIAQIEALFPVQWVETDGQPRYLRELTGRGTAQQILTAFPREQSRARNSRLSKWEDLVELRRRYNDIYKMGYDIKSEDHSIYEDAWLELSENKLPEFLTRIKDAKTKAFEQFQEDFLSRLQNNINNARRQIDELNQALKGATFGEDTYRFRMLPRPEYKRYYDMIVDDMLVGGYSLLSESFNSKYKDEISDLFSLITLADPNGKGKQDEEKRIQEFTDYRTYLTFDLEVVAPDGSTQRLSKTLGKKSGGETQTPFYIAVLASFAQLYRTGRDQNMATARLIIFDEAFSKMDGERIIQSIELLRRFQFQVILSAPPDKVADIATLVDRNLCVYRKGTKTSVQSFSPRHPEVVYES